MNFQHKIWRSRLCLLGFLELTLVASPVGVKPYGLRRDANIEMNFAVLQHSPAASALPLSKVAMSS